MNRLERAASGTHTVPNCPAAMPAEQTASTQPFLALLRQSHDLVRQAIADPDMTVGDFSRRFLRAFLEISGNQAGIILSYAPETQLLQPVADVGLTLPVTPICITDNIPEFDVCDGYGSAQPFTEQLAQRLCAQRLAWARDAAAQAGLAVIRQRRRRAPSASSADDRELLCTAAAVYCEAVQRIEGARGLISARDAATRANKAKSEFLAAMSHELRTPLNAIIGFSEMMTQEIFGPLAHDRYTDYAHCIFTSGQFLLDLINDVLDMSKIEAGKMVLQEEVASLYDLADRALCQVRKQASSKQLRLYRDLKPGLPHIWADPRAIMQILLNLLSNAVKFTPEGGEVHLKILCDTRGTVVMSVRDTGVGIPESQQEAVLQPFHQVPAAGGLAKGTGLGLSLVKSMVDLHGGELGIRSKENQGTIVCVRLPAFRAHPHNFPYRKPRS